MFNEIDTKIDIAMQILKDELNIIPIEVIRFTTGYCHSVYYIKSKNAEFVLRVTCCRSFKVYLSE